MELTSSGDKTADFISKLSGGNVGHYPKADFTCNKGAAKSVVQNNDDKHSEYSFRYIYRAPDVYLIPTSKMDEIPRSCTNITIIIADAQPIHSEWDLK